MQDRGVQRAVKGLERGVGRAAPTALRAPSSTAASRLIVALDVETVTRAVSLARQLRGLAATMKVGSALFTAAGPDAIRRVRVLGVDVFLDLKFHDIPSTVEKSCRAAVHHRVKMLTIHASGQREMLEAAMRGVRDEARRTRATRPLVLGVTVLTSVGEPDSLVTRRVVAMARQARRAGLDGIVASAHEATAIRREVGRALVIVCPGIRPPSADEADQHRVATPSRALAQGADFLVVGRPITEAPDPRARAEEILHDMDQALRR